MENIEGVSRHLSNIRSSWRSLHDGLVGLIEIPARDVFFSEKKTCRAVGSWDRFLSSARNSIIVKGRNPGTSFSLQIEGDSMGLNLTRHDFSGIISLRVDAEVAIVVDLAGTWHPDTPMLLAVEGMGSGTHTLVVTLLDANDMRKGQELVLVSLFLSPESAVIYSPNRALSTLDSILSAPADFRCVSLSSAQDMNIGDRMSSPRLYFPFLGGVATRDVYEWHPRVNKAISERLQFEQQLHDSPVIIGGGGLLNTPWFAPALEYLQYAACSHRILWGVGHNSSDTMTWHSGYDSWNISSADYSLIGVRDFNTRFRWVPCASCMAPNFDKKTEITSGIGFFVHGLTRNTIDRLRAGWPSIPMMENVGDFQLTIRFLASCDTIVTNSFHGAYWGTLLGRKVVAIPTSSKFFSMKHPVPCCDIMDWENHVKLSNTYPDALDECRHSNIHFASMVLEMLREKAPRVDYVD